MEARGLVGGTLVIQDNKMLELIDMKVSMFFIFCHVKNYEDNFNWYS